MLDLALVNYSIQDSYNYSIQDSYLGPVLKTTTRKFTLSGKLLHCVFSRILTTLKEKELWFHFGGQPTRFSIRKFHMVTRFKCSPDSEEREENEEENDEDTGYSWAKTKQRHTTDVLLHIPRDTDEDSSEERFCLAMLLLIESTFLTLYKGCKFPIENLERAQDVEKLTNYPWGEDAFNVPMSSIKKNVASNMMKPKHDIHGFPLALHIWILESIPMLQTTYNRISLIERPTAFLCEKYTSLPSPQLSQIQNIEASYHVSLVSSFNGLN